MVSSPSATPVAVVISESFCRGGWHYPLSPIPVAGAAVAVSTLHAARKTAGTKNLMVTPLVLLREGNC